MGYTVISSTPSPYARKVRINLIEHGIPFTLQTEVPWNKSTETPNYNPLEKLPILIIRPGDSPSAPPSQIVYDSAVILDFLNTSPPPGRTSLISSDPAERHLAKQYEALGDGVCDAAIIATFEQRRDAEHQSREWEDRQMRKVRGGLKAMDEIVRTNEKNGFLVGGKLSIADLAMGSALGFFNLRGPHGWEDEYPALRRYWENLEKRESFKQTVPQKFEIVDKVV